MFLKKIIRPALAVLCVISIVFIVRFIMHTSQSVPIKKIAVLIPAVHPSMQQIETGFVETIGAIDPSIRIDIFNATGDKTLMFGQAQKIASSSYEAVFTIGANASQMMTTALSKKNASTPVVFAAVSDPVALGLVASFNDHNYATGIIDVYNRDEQVSRILSLIPIKNPLIIYCPEGKASIEKDIEACKKAFEHYGITLATLPIYHLNEIQPKLSALITKHDLIITLTDHTICSAMDTIITLCNRFKVPLYTSELDSNDKGAAFSYGVHEKDYGILGAKIVLQLVNEGKSCLDIPITTMYPFYFKINKKAALKQTHLASEKLTPHDDPLIEIKEREVL